MTASRNRPRAGQGAPRTSAASQAGAHEWEFKARFRRHAFGWKSQPAIQRIKQAVSEIKKVARRDPVLAAEGAVLFFERVPGHVPGRRQEVPAQAAGGDPGRPREGDARRRGEVVRRRQGARPLRRRHRARPRLALRPEDLARAARDHVEKQPAFAVEAGRAALEWLAQGFGYEITGADVWMAYLAAMKAAEGLGRAPETKERIRELAASRYSFVAEILGRELGLPR